MDNIIPNRKTRKSLYHALSALIAIAGVWGYIEAEGVVQLTIALGALFGIGGNELAAKNVPANEAPAAPAQ